MAERIELTIDGRAVQIASGATLLDAAREAGITIPVLCYSPRTTANGLCRMCVVEVEGVRGLVASCVTPASAGARVHTESERILRARRTLLEMLAFSVDLSEAPELQALMTAYACRPGRFDGGERRRPDLIDDNPMYIRDYAKCVLCWRCVQVCAQDAQYTYALDFTGRGHATQIGTFLNRPMPETTCVFCGQCVDVCPSGALKPRREWLLEQGMSPEAMLQATLSEKKKRRKS
jgi:NADH dehydrogenase/NADH:ubiquinone oxidoreductase subunit G